MFDSLIPKEQFYGLERIAHLATGGESPMLKSHGAVLQTFLRQKAQGEKAREHFMETLNRTRVKSGQLFNVAPEHITFLSSTSEGTNLLAHALEWQPGDNVVVADVEFPSDVLPWTNMVKDGVELRIVKHKNWQISIDDIAAQIDERTRVVAVSHVSMFTGQRIDLPRLSEVVRASNAIFLLDATHAAGAVPVEAGYADIVISSCYKWLLGVHGTAIFYWNRERLPDLNPPFLGWNSTPVSTSWRNPTQFEFHDNADRFLAGNPSFISLYILDNALDHLLEVGLERIEAHDVGLSGLVWEGINDLGYEMMTPPEAAARAGNVCFMADNIPAIAAALEREDVLIWGVYHGVGRVRISSHLYNDKEDIDRCLHVMRKLA